MTWITHLRQRSIWFLVMLALVLSLALAACGQQTNASHSNATNNYSVPQQSQTGQPFQPGTGNNQGNSIKSIDQQVQSIMRQLDDEGMTQVVRPWASPAFFRLQSGQLKQTTEGLTGCFNRQPLLIGANEKARVQV